MPTYSSMFDMRYEKPIDTLLWINYRPPVRVETEVRENIGIFVPNAGGALMWMPLTEVGKGFSLAYDVKRMVGEFQNPDPYSRLSEMYMKLKEFARNEGLTKDFKITGFTSGFVPDNAVAGILPLPYDRKIFMENKAFSRWIEKISKDYNVSYNAAAKHIMMHEFMHLFGMPGDASSEHKLEVLIEKFADNYINQIEGAAFITDRDRVELKRFLREIKKIASGRQEFVMEIYGGLEGMVHALEKKAKKSGLKSQKDISNYVEREIKKIYKTEYKGDNSYSKSKKSEKRERKHPGTAKAHGKKPKKRAKKKAKAKK